MKKPLRGAVVALFTILATQSTYAALTFSSGTGFSASEYTPTDFFSADIDSAADSISGNVSFTGNDFGGTQQTMTATYEGRAEASQTGGLRASASLALTNGFFADPANSPYVTDFGVTDPGGFPDELLVQSIALMDGAVDVVGPPDLSFIRVLLHLDGILQGGVVKVAQAVYTGPSSLFYTDIFVWGGGSSAFPVVVDQDLVSMDISVSGGLARFGFALIASAGIVHFVQEDFASADFFNTMRIESIAGFNAAGDQVGLTSVTSSDGFAFVTTDVDGGGGSVPEPGSLALLLMGGVLLVRNRRRNVIA